MQASNKKTAAQSRIDAAAPETERSYSAAMCKSQLLRGPLSLGDENA